MSPPNGKTNGSTAHEEAMHATGAIVTSMNSRRQFIADEIHSSVSRLEVPFNPPVVEWRVTNTSKVGKPRGMVIPYANQRAYTDRLNELFSPAGWTRRYTVHTSANFQREKDQKTKMVAKVFVTCELTIFGIGSHSATGEEWADDDNAGTSAEAQAFKRASACFGLGRYLYYFEGVWVDLDERKRPKTIPQLRNTGGLESRSSSQFGKSRGSEGSDPKPTASSSQSTVALAEIEALAKLWAEDYIEDCYAT